METKAIIIGVYRVKAPEPCHLIEVMVEGIVGKVEVGKFTQEVPGLPQDSWQVPYDERLLDPAGVRQMSDDTFPEIVADGLPVRFVFFFHYLNFALPLQSPFGALALPSPTKRPKRLSFIKYEPVD